MILGRHKDTILNCSIEMAEQVFPTGSKACPSQRGDINSSLNSMLRGDTLAEN